MCKPTRENLQKAWRYCCCEKCCYYFSLRVTFNHRRRKLIEPEILLFIRWIMDLQCEGSRNYMSALHVAVENDEEAKHNVGKGIFFPENKVRATLNSEISFENITNYCHFKQEQKLPCGKGRSYLTTYYFQKNCFLIVWENILKIRRQNGKN